MGTHSLENTKGIEFRLVRTLDKAKSVYFEWIEREAKMSPNEPEEGGEKYCIV